MRRAIRGAGAAACGATLLACSAIIGTRDLTYTEGDAGASGHEDGSADDAARDAAQADTASQSDAGACTADTQNDKDNCGRCGHSCLGGACKSGQCQPFAIVQGQAGAMALTLDANNVYWTNYAGDQIMKAGKDGSNVTELAKGAQNNVSSATGIAVDSQFVYWANAVDYDTDPGRIAKCAIGGCNGKGIVLATGLGAPSSVAVDGTNYFWGEGYGWALGRGDKTGPSFGRLANVDSQVDSITVDDKYLYFCSDYEVGRIAKNAAYIPLDGGPEAGTGYDVLFGGNVYGFGAITDDTRIYWAVNDEPGLIQAMPKAGLPQGGTPTTIASGLHLPLGIALDANNIYFTAYGPNTGPDNNNVLFVDGHVFMCPKSGCPVTGPIMLAEKLGWPQEIAVDDTAIYWAQRGNGTADGAIVKLAKP